MFEEFGRMSLADINRKAEELANKGDEEGLRRLASENRIPDELTTRYACGDEFYLCEDEQYAAALRIEIEADDLGAEEIMGDWVDYINRLIDEEDGVAENVMNPKKSLKGCIGELAAYSITHAEPLDKDIIKAIDKAVTDAQLKKLHMERRHLQYTKIGTPGLRTAKKIIRDYYGRK